MKLARVRTHDGAVRLARMATGDETAVLIATESSHPAADAVREALAARIDLSGPGPVVALEDLELLAPVIWPSKILAVGLNYIDHARECGADLPSRPTIFSKAPSSIVGPGAVIRAWNSLSDQVDYEAELAVVIGARAAGELADPLSCVLGFTICNDVSARDAQFADGQWVRGKSFDTFCPLGPWIVTPEELGDHQALGIGTRVDGEKLQDGNTADMIFSVADVIRYLARYLTLEPGDLIATGTPAGVGFARTPPRFLTDGNEVTCWIDGIGELSNPVEGR